MNLINSEERPWGRFFIFQDEPKYKLKPIELDPLGRISYQFDQKRSEVCIIEYGLGAITLGGVEKDYSKGETIFVAQRFNNRIENKSPEKVFFIEVQTGTYFEGDDIVRIEDDYNRF